jgi:hypothetical protein
MSQASNVLNPIESELFRVPLVDRNNFARIESSSPSGSNSAVECDLAKVEVAGSNPVSRSKSFKGEGRDSSTARESSLRLLFENQGGVAKW